MKGNSIAKRKETRRYPYRNLSGQGMCSSGLLKLFMVPVPIIIQCAGEVIQRLIVAV